MAENFELSRLSLSTVQRHGIEALNQYPISVPIMNSDSASSQQVLAIIMPRPHRAEALSDDACLTSVCRVHRA